jgi:hypothetical protein
MDVKYRVDNTYIDEDLADFPVIIHINLFNILEGAYISLTEDSEV